MFRAPSSRLSDVTQLTPPLVQSIIVFVESGISDLRGRTMRPNGFTLVELLVVIAIIGLLVGMLAPSLASARDHARLAACASNLHSIATALTAYAALNKNRLPPFAFADPSMDLAASGHWGGPCQATDPRAFMLGGQIPINLYALCFARIIEPSTLFCPAADPDLRDGSASMFPLTDRFSTYCLRFPFSLDLFRGCERIGTGQPLMNSFVVAAGGQIWSFGDNGPAGGKCHMPQVQLGRTYATDPAIPATGDSEFDPAADTILADTFWWPAVPDSAPSFGGKVWPVRGGFCHDSRFNVCSGGGAVRPVDDDGTIAAITYGGSDSAGLSAARAERAWQFFDTAGKP